VSIFILRSLLSSAGFWFISTSQETGGKNVSETKLIDRLRATRWTPPDYWQTDNSNGLVMVIRNYHWLNSASRVLKSTGSAPLVQTGERKQFSLFDLDLWPTTLNYNPRLAKVKVDPRAKNQGQRSNGSNRRVPTDKRTDGHTHTHTDATKRIIAPATRSIITYFVPKVDV